MPLIQWIMQNLSGAQPDVLVGGTALVHTHQDILATGGVECSGNVFNGIFVGGSGVAGKVYSITASGGVVINGTATPGASIVSSGGVIVAGTSRVYRILYPFSTVIGGVIVGGTAGVSAFVPDCGKPDLDHHPIPSIADYRPQTVAPLIEFFVPIVQSLTHHNPALTKCNLEFRYENNTPCDPTDDIFVRHPLCISLPYTPKRRPKKKSKQLLLYEKYAKKSKRLEEFEDTNNIEYFLPNKDQDYEDPRGDHSIKIRESSIVTDTTVIHKANTTRTWFSPAVGSTDFLNLITNPDDWSHARSITDVLLFTWLACLDSPPMGTPIEGNNWAAFSNVGLVSFLNANGIVPAFFTGIWKPQYCSNASQAIADAMNALRNLINAGAPHVIVDIDEAFYGAVQWCGVTDLFAQAQRITDFMNALTTAYPGQVTIGLTEPYPPWEPSPPQQYALNVAQIEAAVGQLITNGTTPAHFHLDVNWKLVNLEPTLLAQLAPDLLELKRYFLSVNIPFAVIFWPGNSESDNTSYVTDVQSWAAQVRAIVGTTTDTAYQDWVFSNPPTNTQKRVPNNLPETTPYTATWMLLH